MNHCHWNNNYYYYFKGKKHTHTHTHTHTRDREQHKDDTNVNTHATVAVSFGNCTKALAGTAAAGRQAGRSTAPRISHESTPREAPAFDDYAKRRREQSKQSEMKMKKKKLFFLYFLPSLEEALTQLPEFNHKILVGFFCFCLGGSNL